MSDRPRLTAVPAQRRKLAPVEQIGQVADPELVAVLAEALAKAYTAYQGAAHEAGKVLGEAMARLAEEKGRR